MVCTNLGRGTYSLMTGYEPGMGANENVFFQINAPVQVMNASGFLIRCTLQLSRLRERKVGKLYVQILF